MDTLKVSCEVADLDLYVIEGESAYDIVKQYAQSKIGTFTKQEALIACPSLGSSSVEAALKKLVSEGVIDRLGAGRQTHYVRNEE